MDLLGLELSWLLILPQAPRLSPSYSYENSVSINWVPAGELWRNGCIRTIATQEAGYLLCSSHPLTLFCSDYFLPSSLPFFLSSPLPYSLLGIEPRALCMQDQACGSLCHRTISPASPPHPPFFGDRVSFCIPDCSGTLYVDEYGIDLLKILPPSLLFTFNFGTGSHWPQLTGVILYPRNLWSLCLGIQVVLPGPVFFSFLWSSLLGWTISIVNSRR